MIKNIIFDFDGTLADTSELIVAATKKNVEELGLEPRSIADYKSTIGWRIDYIPQRLWPDITEETKEKYIKGYRRIFDEFKTKFRIKLFPGVSDVLRKLHSEGYNLAIATSRNQRTLNEFIDTLGIKDYFSILMSGDDVKTPKPSPEPVLTILDKMNWKAEETLTVGDMAVDILMGKNAGTYTLGVTYGNGSAEEFRKAGVDLITDEFNEIPALISAIS